MIGIYRIVSPSNKIYIGQTWNSSKRFSNYRKLRCEGQVKLYNSLRKYGFDAHIIDLIHELPSDIEQQIMDDYERFYLEVYGKSHELLNLREGGSRGRHTKETIEKMKLTTHGREFLLIYNQREDRYRRPKGFYKNRRHPREYKVVQTDKNGNSKLWDSIRQIKEEIKYNSQNLCKAIKTGTKYKNSYWKKFQ
jgi:group I intron endonuclease